MFQFPSNGKVFLNYFKPLKITLPHISFQFPSNGKVFLNERSFDAPTQPSLFQFPSNGKVFLNRISQSWTQLHRSVSIPFKREGLSELKIDQRQTLEEFMFQFPSNGKVFLNLIKKSNEPATIAVSFNSLQTGRSF